MQLRVLYMHKIKIGKRCELDIHIVRLITIKSNFKVHLVFTVENAQVK